MAQLGASWHRPRRPPPSSAPASQESPRRPCRTSTPALFRPCPPPTAPSSASALLGLVAPCSLRPPPALLGLTPPYSLHPPLLFLGLAPPCSLRAAATTARSWRRRLPAIHSDQPVCDIFSSSSIPLSHLFLSSHFQQRRSSALNLLICYPGILLHPPPPCTCAGVLLACRGWPAPSWWLRTRDSVVALWDTRRGDSYSFFGSLLGVLSSDFIWVVPQFLLMPACFYYTQAYWNERP